MLDQVEASCENPTGYYSTEFIVDDEWVARRTILSFLGVDSAFYLWINNHYIGFSKDSRLPAEFDVGSHLKYGDDSANVLEVIVCRLSDGNLFENQDMWNMNGIFRDVLLSSYPLPLHIYDFAWDLEIGTTAYYTTQGKAL